VTFFTCGRGDPFVEVGKKQTPVDIVPAEAVDAFLLPLVHRYEATPFVVENTGHVVEVPYAPGSTLHVGLDRYELLQFHFHAPSEHAVNGQLADAELHLVHRNALLDLAVVGVLVNVGSPVNVAIDDACAMRRWRGEIELHGLQREGLLPRSSGKYYYGKY
jgi:carbonic anhydrase